MIKMNKCDHEWDLKDQFQDNIILCVCSLCGEEVTFIKNVLN